MKTKTSMLKIARNLGSVGLLFSLSNMDCVSAIKTVSQSGEGSEALAESEIENMIKS